MLDADEQKEHTQDRHTQRAMARILESLTRYQVSGRYYYVVQKSWTRLDFLFENGWVMN